MNDDEMYVHRPGIAVAREHVSRYPRHYAALGLFLVAMLLVPTVGPRDLADLAASSSPAGATAPEGALPLTPPATSAPAPAAPPSTAARAVADAFGIDTETAAAVIDAPAGGTAAPPPSGGGDAPAPAPDDGQDAGPAGAPLPAPPPVPLPAAPEELQPLLAAVEPLTTHGCSGLGLAAVVVAVVGTTAQDVPVGQVLPYLAPVYSACAAFPPPGGDPTICEIDRAAHDAGYPTDVSGLMKTPNAIGTGIDVLYGIEAAIEAYTGQSPDLVAGIADQLGCTA